VNVFLIFFLAKKQAVCTAVGSFGRACTVKETLVSLNLKIEPGCRDLVHAICLLLVADKVCECVFVCSSVHVCDWSPLPLY
jgi:hypothetical protein